MYCVIQEIELRKEDTNGAYKELISDCTEWTSSGERSIKYSYRYTGDRFIRPIKKAYRISIHKSYRENGKIKKTQKVICTMKYYDIIDCSSYIGDYCIGIEDKAKALGITLEELEDMVYKKLDPIIEKVRKEFEATEEYVIHNKHKKILNEYFKNKREFEEIYGNNTYDYCYDVFGNLKEKDKLEAIKKQYEANKESERRYYEEFQNNYKDNWSSYFNLNQSSYGEDDKKKLKKIYRTLSAKFHPDIYKDDGEMMKFINKLKEDWGL